MASKPESLPELFDAVKAKFPATLGPERWYLVTVSKHAPPPYSVVTDTPGLRTRHLLGSYPIWPAL